METRYRLAGVKGENIPLPVDRIHSADGLNLIRVPREHSPEPPPPPQYSGHTIPVLTSVGTASTPQSIKTPQKGFRTCARTKSRAPLLSLPFWLTDCSRSLALLLRAPPLLQCPPAAMDSPL